MSRLNMLFGCFAMASILLFSACDGFDPDDSEEAVKVQATLLINTPTQDIVEGSYTITCQPSGKIASWLERKSELTNTLDF